MLNIVQTGGDEVTIISRDSEGKRTLQKIKSTPYFYAPHPNGENISLFGQRLKKIEVRVSGDVGREREKYIDTHESDILFVNRILIDKFDEIPIVPIRHHYMDIEVDNSLDILTAPKPIICISVFDTFLNCYNTFAWREDQDNKKQEVKDETTQHKHKIWFFNNEKDMILKYISFVKATDPDIFHGWNLLGYDWIYFINRCKVLNISLRPLAFFEKEVSFKIRDDWNDVNIPGRYVFDTYRAYKLSVSKELEDNTLNAVARKVLGKEKVDIDNFSEVWRADLKKLINRCKVDVEICRQIDEVKGLFDYYDETRRTLKARWEDIWNTTKSHDILFLRKAKARGVRLPKNPHSKRDTMNGGFVHDVTPGLYKNVIVLDAQSLYPFIIKTFNISPETIAEDGDIEIPGICRFKSSPLGIAAEVVDDLLNLRESYKREMRKYSKDTPLYKKYYWKQYVTKILCNKTFGYLGANHARLFKIQCARAITEWGKLLNKWSARKAVEFSPFVKVVYGDTDSIFIKCPDDWTIDQCDSFGKEMAQKITESYQNFVNSFYKGTSQPPKSLFNLQYEDKVYEAIFFRSTTNNKGARKRYYGLLNFKNNEGKWEKKTDVTGFEIIRSDSATIEKETMDKVYETLMQFKGRDEVHTIINTTKNELKQGKYSPDMFALRTGKNMETGKDVYIHAAEWE